MATDSSRSFKIKLLLLIDTAFFFIELIVGYSVGSLALVADSFHMLNDVFSLLVALYAIKLTSSSKRSHEHSYGWQRAEILGALINGVFLLALCFSIFIEAIQRMFAPVGISNPPLVVIVGSLGLASNIVGLFLFHEHGHTHGDSHSHSHSHSRSHPHDFKNPPILTHPDVHHHPAIIDRPSKGTSPNENTPLLLSRSEPHPSILLSQASPVINSSCNSSPSKALSHESTLEPSPTAHPAPTSNYDITAVEQQSDCLCHDHHLLDSSTQSKSVVNTPTVQIVNDLEASSSHNLPSHSHMNMRGIFLHALGDALGNMGVILTGLLMWLLPVGQDPNFSKNFWVIYADPIISLVITAIIFTSALPLVRSASLILLQSTPSHIDLGRVQKSLEAIEGVLQVHELHIWSLSELKSVASVHVLIQNHDQFVNISRQIRKSLHDYGIHSSTIQPEIVVEESVNSLGELSTISPTLSSIRPLLPRAATSEISNIIDADGCLQQCDETCDQEACCPPGSIVSRPSAADLPSTS